MADQALVTTSDNLKAGGIAWSGSLVGSNNPSNLGYRYSTPSKRFRVQDDENDGKRQLPTNLQIQFRNRQGEELAESLDVPIDATVDDLTALLQSLLGDESRQVPYSFYAQDEHGNDIQVTSSLSQLLQSTAISTETLLQLTYQPLSVFRVRPVTRCTDTLPGHTEAVLHVSFSPDGKWLASGGGDATIRFWQVATAMPKKTCTSSHRNHVLCTAWSPTGHRLASGDKNGVLLLWDPTSKENQPVGKHIQAHKQWITGLSWEPLHTSTDASSSCRLATSGKDATIKIWNTKTHARIHTLSGHTDSVEAIRWGGESLLYSASRDRTIKAWNPNSGILVRTLVGHGHRVNTLALSSDFVLRTGPFDFKNLSFPDDATMLEAAKKKYAEFAAQQQGPERLVSGSDDFTLFLWHPKESKHPIKRLTGHQQAVNHISFSPDGRYFASASFDKKVKVWNGYSGEFLNTLTGHVGAVYQVSWSPDSRYLVSASKDSTAKLWEISSAASMKKARETLPGHADEVYALDWSPTGSGVATGSKDRTIKIWKH